MRKVFTLTLLLAVLITCTLSGCGNSDGFFSNIHDNYVDNIAGDYNQSDSNQTVNPPCSTPANNSAANKDYEEAIRAYVAVANGSLTQAENLAPREFWEQEETLADAKKAFQQKRADLTEEYGYDFVYTVNILSDTKMSADDLAPLKSSWARTYNGNPNDLIEGYFLQITSTVTSSQGTVSIQETFPVVKIRDKWYITCNTDVLYFPPDPLL